MTEMIADHADDPELPFSRVTALQDELDHHLESAIQTAEDMGRMLD